MSSIPATLVGFKEDIAPSTSASEVLILRYPEHLHLVERVKEIIAAVP